MFLRDRKKPQPVKLAQFVDSGEAVEAVEALLPSGETLWSPDFVERPRPMHPAAIAPLKLSDFDDPPEARRRRIGA